MNRKRLFLALALGIALVLLCVSAALAEDPIKVSMELSKYKFSGPETITVSITVTNIGDGDMPSPVKLYYPSGKQVEEFGSPTLSVGGSKRWTGDWKVTQDQLDAGKVVFQVRYSYYEGSGDGEPQLIKKGKNFSKKITFTGADPEVSVTRTITPTTAQKGQEVSVIYEIANTGSVDVTSVNIKENTSISSKSGTIDSIAAGATGTYTFTAVMGSKDLTSNATVSYKAGGKTFTTKVGSATVKYGEVNLSATLKADKKGGAPGDTVKLTLTLKNSGNLDFTNVTVTDAELGTVFSGESVKAGETLTLEKDLAITTTQELQFTVTADETTGIRIVERAIEEPLRQIVENAGLEGSVVVNNVKAGEADYGYNARADKYEALKASGIIDPAKVARVALENAASIAGMFLTTECVICDAKEDKPEMPMGGAPGMGGMM